MPTTNIHRPMFNEQITLRLPNTLLKRIDSMAVAEYAKRATIMRRFIVEGLRNKELHQSVSASSSE